MTTVVPLKSCGAATTAQEKSCVFNKAPTHDTHKWQKLFYWAAEQVLA